MNIIREQQDWVRDTIAPTLTDGAEPKYIFLARKGTNVASVHSAASANDSPTSLRQSSFATNTAAQSISSAPTGCGIPRQLRCSTPVHHCTSCSYLGHVSPEMTLRYAKTLARGHEQEFLRLTLIGTDGRDHDIDQHALLDVLQLDQRTDRILANGYCLLPRPKTCEQGSACLTCGEFTTNAIYLTELEDQRNSTLDLIETRRTQHFQRTSNQMTDDNMWLTARRSEKSAHRQPHLPRR